MPQKVKHGYSPHWTGNPVYNAKYIFSNKIFFQYKFVVNYYPKVKSAFMIPPPPLMNKWLYKTFILFFQLKKIEYLFNFFIYKIIFSYIYHVFYKFNYFKT